MMASCLAVQFARLGRLDDEDVETLEDIQRNPLHVAAGTTLREQGRAFGDVI
jgi:hypothetical protein